MWTREILQKQRAKYINPCCTNVNGWTINAGRTGTRHRAGAVNIRREDSLLAANEFLAEANLKSTLKQLRRR